jgi:sensor histidine kinase regulating citrate/malate metabolism
MFFQITDPNLEILGFVSINIFEISNWDDTIATFLLPLIFLLIIYIYWLSCANGWRIKNRVS